MRIKRPKKSLQQARKGCRSWPAVMKRSMSRVLQSRYTRRDFGKRGAALGASAAMLGGASSLVMPSAYAQDGGSVSLASYSSDPVPRANLKALIEQYNTTRTVTFRPRSTPPSTKPSSRRSGPTSPRTHRPTY